LKFRFFKTSRTFHKWTGFVCAIFFIILSISGVLLMHRDSLGLDRMEIAAKYLPEKYFTMAGDYLNVQSLAISPGLSPALLVGTPTGLYRSSDLGSTWTQLRDGLRDQDIRVIALHPRNPRIIYVGTSKGIFLSEDGGDHWTDWFDKASGLENIDIRDLVFDPDNPETLFAGTQGGVFRSEDGGEMWDAVLTGKEFNNSGEIKKVVFSSEGKSLYATSDQGVYRSLDRGETWQTKWKNTVPPPLELVSLDTDPEFIYLGSAEGLFKSFNRGITWVSDPTLKKETVHKVLIDSTKTTDIYLATADNLYFSKDGGDGWISMIPGSLDLAGLKDIQIHHFSKSQMPWVFAGTRKDLYISRDGGKNWKETALAETVREKTGGHLKMDLVKVMTEIHTGRFFGNYVYLLVDLATFGLILLVFSGYFIDAYRRKASRSKVVREKLTEEKAVDTILTIQETAEDLSVESQQIHDMIEHINTHLAKCKTVYLSKDKKEIDKIGQHITTIDKKMHHLMKRIAEIDKI